MIAQEKPMQQQPEEIVQSGHPDEGTIWQHAIYPYLISRLVLFMVGLLAALYILPLLKSNPVLPSSANTRLPDALWLIWSRFDAGFYVDIAKNGYWPASTLQGFSNWIFLPLYPLFISPLGHLFGGSVAAYDISGILISNAAGLLAVIYFYRLVSREFHTRLAARAVTYLVIFPTAFYLSAIYPEALFLACVLACIYYGREKRWWLSGLFGALATATRIQGFLLVLPIFWEYWQALSQRYVPLSVLRDLTLKQKSSVWLHSRLVGPWLAVRELSNWLNLGALILIPCGLVPFFIYSKILTGDPLATIHNHSAGWGRHFQYPWRLLIQAFTHPQLPNALNWNFWLLNILVVIAFIGFTFWSLRRLPMTYTIYCIVMVGMPLATGSLNSISRYYLVVFPAFILLALWSDHEKQPARYFLLVALFASLQAILLLFYVLGLPAIA